MMVAVRFPVNDPGPLRGMLFSDSVIEPVALESIAPELSTTLTTKESIAALAPVVLFIYRRDRQMTMRAIEVDKGYNFIARRDRKLDQSNARCIPGRG